MGQLFDKTYDELREAFVRKRFAEPDIFDREDIEEWLASRQVPCESGDDHTAWLARGYLRHLEVTWDERADSDPLVGLVLRQHITPLNAPRAWFRSKLFHGEPFIRTVEVLRAGGAEIYYPYFEDEDRVVIVVMDREVFALETADADHWAKHAAFARLRRAKMWEVVELFLDEYICGRPNARQALEFMRSDYGRAVQAMKQKATRDFDEAVAVSADGTKIVHTSWVFVAEGRSPTSGLLFPASAFRQNKIQCGTTISHVNVERWQLEQISYNRNELSLDRFLSSMLVGWGRSWVVNGVACLVSDTACRDIMRPGETVLFVDKDTCPSPLPDGGREIRV